MRRCIALLAFAALATDPLSSWPAERHVAAQVFGKVRSAVAVQPDGLYVCEAEEFRTEDDAGGWRARPFGENYYAATFANCFLSRKAFLGAPEQCEESIAEVAIDVPDAGRYLVLVRYEAAYRFETQFRVQVEQNGDTVFDRLYGARENVKIWAFGQKLQKEVAWSWGAVENIVWEGHDAYADLQPSRATLRLIAARQPEPAAKRNVDLVMLTADVEQVQMRIDKENYLPLDGMLTQSGDVWLRVTNQGPKPLTFTGRSAPGGGNWQQHSPYWVHLRNWKAPAISVEPGETSDWIEVGGLMDSLADGQWLWTGDGPYKAEFGVRNAAGRIEPLADYTGEGDLTLAADADTRYSRRLRAQEAELYDLLDYLKREDPAPHGRTPQETPIYGYTFEPLDKGKHAATVAEFKELFALRETGGDGRQTRYLDVRGVSTDKLAEHCRKLGAEAPKIDVVSLGDEIALPTPAAPAASDGFRQWLQSRGLKPSEVDPTAGDDWAKISYNVDPQTKESRPGVYYWSMRYLYHFGIQAIKERTDILRRHFPRAGIGANYSPHYPTDHMFLGETYKWVSVFREEGMTLPWSEDYIWQVPVGTPQMNHINFALFRAGLRGKPDRKIMYYVMPHMPNNTPRQWRRLFYGALGNGMKAVNLFEFRPVHVAYTENHVDHPEMYRMILQSFRELGLFEDVVQHGRVRAAEAGLWFSETGDIWDDSHGSFAPAKRALFTAIRQQQIPLDAVVEQDALEGTLDDYKTLYLTDAHVSAAASERIAAWVRSGGSLFATAGAGMFDELNRPNQTLRELMGVSQASLDVLDGRQVTYLKQDLPFTEAIDAVKLADAELPVFCIRGRITTADGDVTGTFTDGSPAMVSRTVGKGRTVYCAFLPSLSYYKPAIPRRPVDRGATDDAMIHFLPTAFDPAAAALIAQPASAISLPVQCSNPLVETTVIESKQGTAIPLINWSGSPVKTLRVKVSIPTPTAEVALAGGGPVTVEQSESARVYTFDLDVADALILR
ncbi:MAG: beta-galactosidase trimerization domain-containing protein [Planctomycetes bacterium]|nr:beta-galactosidase trimerization domain-containing protein [Planctomycetota bacterium]